MGHETAAVPSIGVSDKKLFSMDHLPFSLETVIKKWKFFYPKWVTQVGSLLEARFWVLSAQQKQNTWQQPCRAPSLPRQLRFSPELLSSSHPLCCGTGTWRDHPQQGSIWQLECSELLLSIVLRTVMAQLQCVQNEPHRHQSMPKEMQLAHFYLARSQSLIQHAYFIFLSLFFVFL